MVGLKVWVSLMANMWAVPVMGPLVQGSAKLLKQLKEVE